MFTNLFTSMVGTRRPQRRADASEPMAPEAPSVAPDHASDFDDPLTAALIGSTPQGGPSRRASSHRKADGKLRVKFARRPDPISAAPTAPYSIYQHLTCTAIALAMFLIAPRAATAGFDRSAFRSPFEQFPVMCLAAVYDVCTVAVLALAAAGVMRLLEKRRVGQLVTMFAFDGLGVIMLAISFANIAVVKMLGAPFNYRWTYYSDLFRTSDGHHVLLKLFPPHAVLAVFALCGAMLSCSFVMRWAVIRLRTTLPCQRLAIALAPAVLLYLFFGHWYLTTQKWDHDKLCNPLVSFVGSLLGSYDAPALLTMRTPFMPDDVMTVSDRKGAPAYGATTNPGVRNVVLFVMQSVPAQYLDVYGGKYRVTPTLTKYRDRSMLFRDVYAHAPATDASMVSILCSNYPWVSCMDLTQEHADAPLTSLPAALKSAGNYRTGYFASDDAAGSFLAHRQFDRIDVLRSSAVDDVATAGAAVDWITAGDVHAPFFACLWTSATDNPSAFPGADRMDYEVGSKTLNRYLNSLKHGDAALGRILDALEKRDLLDSTLVVVVGDHGESFGRHDPSGHGPHLYEENLKVPAILINPKLFKGEERKVVGGVVDIAPTIMDVLGQTKLPGDWQGHSLLAPKRFDRVYLFAPRSDLLFGYRDGDKKLIYSATRNEFEVYDLKSDPTESSNIAARETAFVHSGQQRMAAWVQYQHRFYNGMFKAKPLFAPSVATTKPSVASGQ